MLGNEKVTEKSNLRDFHVTSLLFLCFCIFVRIRRLSDPRILYFMLAPGAGNRAGRHVHFKLQGKLKKHSTSFESYFTFTQTAAKAE